ncbi:DsbA family protein [Deinococcus aerius]|uniref:DsbA family protein n=1 Tax=Deinococcus aerius TaxID=200253 RepID=UPI000CCC6CB5
MSHNLRFFKLAVGLVLLAGAFATGTLWSRPQVRQVFRPINTHGQPTLGRENAPVQVVVFADFKCPFCARFESDVFPRLKDQYINTGKVQYSFVNLAFLGPDSNIAAQAGECVAHQDQNLFWKFVDNVYQHQGDEAKIWATPEEMTRIATNLSGIGIKEFQNCLAQSRFADAVESDRKLAESTGVQGTPDIYINGIRAPRFGYDTVSQLIDAALQLSRG